ncbi:MAG: hypothetical protein GY950_14695 [bacterium]|nr:hypothetical protein [bacterium]
MIVGNWSECAFEEECNDPETSNSGTGSGIGIYIVDGAGFLLNSHSGMTAFLNRVEMAEFNGTDFNELREILYQAAEDMEKAKSAYYNLKNAAAQKTYSQPVITKLSQFDYDGFQTANGLNAGIFGDVKNYLHQGDIRGIYDRFLQQSEAILEQLYIVKASVDSDNIPDISSLWRINGDYSEFILFGQYTSEVFKAIL